MYVKLVKIIEQATCDDNRITLCTIMYCASTIEKMDRITMHININARNQEKIFFNAKNIDNIVRSDSIPIDSCDMNLTNASDSVRSIIGASNRAHLGISIFRSDNKILARCYENLDVCGECPLM